MADEDFRFVHREETFNDLAVRELAKSRSACICRVQFKRCTTDECEHCPVNERFQTCFDSMSDYDKQRLSSYIAKQYVIDSRDPEAWLSHKGLLMHTVGMVLGAAIMFTLFLYYAIVIFGGCGNIPESRVNQMIIDTLECSHSQVRDLDYNGTVNCIDYAVTFKCIWDLKYPEYKNMCEIIRNRNINTGMHHLFVRILNDRKSIYVETWAQDINKYLMEDNWTRGKYDSRLNISGETGIWLRRCKRGISNGFEV